MGQRSFLWDREVSCRTEDILMGQRSFLWDRGVSCGTEVSCETEKIHMKQGILLAHLNFLPVTFFGIVDCFKNVVI